MSQHQIMVLLLSKREPLMLLLGLSDKVTFPFLQRYDLTSSMSAAAFRSMLELLVRRVVAPCDPPTVNVEPLSMVIVPSLTPPHVIVKSLAPVVKKGSALFCDSQAVYSFID